jgi:trehalose/maltose hydrolase-like predicted phosphorylase
VSYDTWTVVNTTPQPHTLGQWNSVATVSNGYLGLKGNLAEQRDGFSAVTLINGVYDELDMFSQIRASNEERRYLDARYFDTAGRSPAVANLPNPLFVQAYVGEREVSLNRGEVSNFAQSLDLATGVYRYTFDYRDSAGRTTRIAMERFATLRHAHRVFMRYSVTPLDHDAPVRIRSGITGAVFSNTTRERQFSVTELWADPAERVRLVARTPARGHLVRMGVVNRLLAAKSGPSPLAEPPVGVADHDAVWSYYILNVQRGQTVTLERAVVLASSEDLRHGQMVDLERELDAAAAQGFDAALAEQKVAWRELWDRCDVQIDGDDPAQLGLRFCLFHILQAAPRFTDRLSVPVKLLTGEYYQGNTFYDTDTYILPVYALTLPEIARTCLNWRYEGLRPGREIARNLGYDGVKFAWQAGPSGEECLGRWWRFTHTNIHINCDVAYALVQYWRASGDDRYMAERGVDLLVETARFFAARAKYDAARDRYDLVEVAGPDEGHSEATNDFYTNYLALKNLRWAAALLDYLQAHDADAHAAAVRRLALKPEEPAKWRHVADRLTLHYDPQTHVYEQCNDFYKLKPIPTDLLEERKVWFVTVFPYQALNQPDVVMAQVMLRDEFPPAVVKANWDFYNPKSMNFSSMSFVLNCIMAADVGDLAEAYKNFIITCGEDLDEGLTGRKDTSPAPRGPASGGAWMAAVFGFGGVHLPLPDDGPAREGTTGAARPTTRSAGTDAASSAQAEAALLRIRPNLPAQWTGLRFNLVLRGVLLNVAIDRQQLTVKAVSGPKAGVVLELAGKVVTLKPGQTETVPL